MSTTETKKQKGIFSKILVAIDGSKHSMDAAYYAINVSNKFNADMFSFGIYDLETPTHRKLTVEHIIQKVKEWFDEVKVKANEKNIQLSKAELIGTSASVGATHFNRAVPLFILLIFKTTHLMEQLVYLFKTAWDCSENTNVTVLVKCKQI
jgi:hypothetical protein